MDIAIATMRTMATRPSLCMGMHVEATAKTQEDLRRGGEKYGVMATCVHSVRSQRAAVGRLQHRCDGGLTRRARKEALAVVVDKVDDALAGVVVQLADLDLEFRRQEVVAATTGTLPCSLAARAFSACCCCCISAVSGDRTSARPRIRSAERRKQSDLPPPVSHATIVSHPRRRRRGSTSNCRFDGSRVRSPGAVQPTKAHSEASCTLTAVRCE